MTFVSKTGSYKAGATDIAYGNVQKTVTREVLKDSGSVGHGKVSAATIAEAALAMLALLASESSNNADIQRDIMAIVQPILDRDWSGYTLPGTPNGQAKDRYLDAKAISATIATKAMRL